MTISFKRVIGVLKLRSRSKENDDFTPPKGFFGTQEHCLGDWSGVGDDIYKFIWGANANHLFEFGVALLCYFLLYADGKWLTEAQTWQNTWILKIVGYNLACEIVIYGGWHWFTYCNKVNAKALKGFKYNPVNQYEPDGSPVGMICSSTGNLEREIFYNTLGWLQSAFWQVLFTHLWAVGYFQLPDMSQTNNWYWTGFLLWIVEYYRNCHFYWIHRAEHPWFGREKGLLDGDIGAFLYRHAHSVHHKSYNTGPWAGLAMHPIEHFLYYSCATLMPVLLPNIHPLVFLYCKFHADISACGGHDGHADPAGGSDYHQLHHAKFECNYGVPYPINWDKIFGTWQDYRVYKANGDQMSLGLEGCGRHALVEVEKAVAAELQGAGFTERLLCADPKMPFTLEQVSRYNTRGNCLIVIEDHVLDVTSFISEHPGGEQALLTRAGKDVTSAFIPIHREGLATFKRFPDKIRQVGTLVGALDEGRTSITK